MKRTESIFLIVVVLFIAGFLFASDRVPARQVAPDKLVSGRFASTGWYCPAPSAEGVGSVMSVANLGAVAVRLRTQTIGDGRRSDSPESDVASRRRVSFGIEGFGVPSSAGVVEAFGAATDASVFTSGNGIGLAASRCTVQPWDKWFLPIAGTARGQDHYLLVANPFQEEAVIKVRVIAPDRDVVPARLKDLVVPAFSELPVYLAEYVPETASFGLEVSATRGRIIVSRYSRFVTKDGVKGISLSLGSRFASTDWIFGGGGLPKDGEESIVLINPSAREALVQVVYISPTDQLAPESLQELQVPAGRQLIVKSSDFTPRGTDHGIVITSSNGVAIVAERMTVAGVPDGKGFETDLGVVQAAHRWSLDVGSVLGGAESIAITNPGRSPATVNITLLTDKAESKPPELLGIRVDAGRRVNVDITRFIQGAPATAVIEAISGEVVPERRLVIGSPYADFADTVGQPFD